jgi:uncharacterized coiled-coil protein SlyX
MAKQQQSASELSRTLAGQWTKTEKRSVAARAIMEAKKATHRINKNFAQQQRMK